MPHIITSICQIAKDCIEVCPTDAIHFVEDNPEWPLVYISPDECIDCAACAMDCPHEAIFADDEVPDEYQADIQKNADFFTTGPGKALV